MARNRSTQLIPCKAAAHGGPEKRLGKLADKFEEIEHRQFGKDGFEDAVATITRVEQQLGLADLAQCTPPAPPRVGQGAALATSVCCEMLRRTRRFRAG